MGDVADRGVVHPEVVADGTHDHEAGMQSHPEGQVYIAAGRHGHRVRLDRASDVERGQYRPARVVLVRDRRAEQRHETVAQELIDGALVAMDLSQRAVEEAAQQRVHFVGAELLGERRRTDDVAEQHGHRLALALQGAARREDLFGEMPGRIGFRRGGSVRRLDRLAAGRTESRPLRQVGAARRTA